MGFDEASARRLGALAPRMRRFYQGIVDEFYDALATRVPMRRVATPDEVVQAMLWICAPENSFMTGQAVSIDGGLTAI